MADLIIVQATPFCNIACTYCYLPEKDMRGVMSEAVFSALLQRISNAPELSDRVTIGWHAGEPLAAPLSFFQWAWRETLRLNESSNKHITFNFQTNGTLITDKWADFLAIEGVSVCLSLDGPKEVHDAARRYRSGKGSFDATWAGLETLKRHDIPFEIISVVTTAGIRKGREIYRFLAETGTRGIGFNIEEVEGVNEESSVTQDALLQDVPAFWRAICEEYRRYPHVAMRELDGLASALSYFPEMPDLRMQVALPYRIVNVDVRGNFSLFSPELLGWNTHLGSFHFGNVMLDDFSAARHNSTFIAAEAEINAGVEKCKANCSYFSLCGGGSPSNKFFEHGRFDTTTTQFCTANRIAPIDAFLEYLDR